MLHAGRNRRADGGAVDDEPPDFSGQFNTPLSSAEEKQYGDWVTARSAATGRNVGADTYDYDLRGAWKSNADAAANGHLPDDWKKPNHPTFSDQSRYSGRDGYTGGSWKPGDQQGQWNYEPSATNLRMHGAPRLQRYFDEREKGNSVMLPQARDDGGAVTGFGGPAPDPANANPQVQQQYQRFASMTPEQLQEMAVRLGASSMGQMAQRVLRQKQMVGAEAPTPAPQSYALGGGTLAEKGGLNIPERFVHTPDSGFLNTTGAGRTDNINIKPRSNSYVMPADVVSGLGQGNSLAGAQALDHALSSGPYGVPMPKAGRPSGFGRMPRRADGGEVAKRVPIIAAGGEYVISPEQVAALGGGDHKRGHDVLDAFVLHVRKRTIGEMKKLKGPVGAKRK